MLAIPVVDVEVEVDVAVVVIGVDSPVEPVQRLVDGEDVVVVPAVAA